MVTLQREECRRWRWVGGQGPQAVGDGEPGSLGLGGGQQSVDHTLGTVAAACSQLVLSLPTLADWVGRARPPEGSGGVQGHRPVTFQGSCGPDVGSTSLQTRNAATQHRAGVW